MYILSRQLRTYPLQYGFRPFRAIGRTTSSSPSSTPTSGTSKTPEIDVQKGGDVIHRPTEEVSVILNVLHSPLEVLKVGGKTTM